MTERLKEKEAENAELREMRAPSLEVTASAIAIQLTDHYIHRIRDLMETAGLLDGNRLGEPDMSSDDKKIGWLHRAKGVILEAGDMCGAANEALKLINGLMGL